MRAGSEPNVGQLADDMLAAQILLCPRAFGLHYSLMWHSSSINFKDNGSGEGYFNRFASFSEAEISK